MLIIAIIHTKYMKNNYIINIKILKGEYLKKYKDKLKLYVIKVLYVTNLVWYNLFIRKWSE